MRRRTAIAATAFPADLLNHRALLCFSGVAKG